MSIAVTPPAQVVNPGDTAVYTVNLAGVGGAPFTGPVTLTATGLPPGATVTFGKTRGADGAADGQYHVVYEYEEERVGEAAGALGVGVGVVHHEEIDRIIPIVSSLVAQLRKSSLY